MATMAELWVRESGELERDVAYLQALKVPDSRHAYWWRQRELKRLALLHGEGYVMNVERALKDGVGCFERVAGLRQALLEKVK